MKILFLSFLIFSQAYSAEMIDCGVIKGFKRPGESKENRRAHITKSFLMASEGLVRYTDKLISYSTIQKRGALEMFIKDHGSGAMNSFEGFPIPQNGKASLRLMRKEGFFGNKALVSLTLECHRMRM
jgi:hypothetical protein